ncbi:MAG TPA: hypothetical protein EYP18_08085, partial [Desulfobacterales bacterium]|nr:hypothetical protein [Desulfobacterales bacterium]
MSLSKFYNNSSAFKAKSVLDKNAVSSAGPVWGSIVKNEEPGVQEALESADIVRFLKPNPKIIKLLEELKE